MAAPKPGASDAQHWPWPVRVWCAVLETLLIDASCMRTDTSSAELRRLARDYLSKPSRDLHWILGVLGLDVGWWHTRALPHLQARWRELDAARSPTKVRRRPGRPPRLDRAA